MQKLEERITDLVPDFKICPNCGKKFTKEEYFKEHIHDNEKRKLNWWRSKKYCCYKCSNEFFAKTWSERQLTKITQNQMKFTAPIEVWNVEKGEIKDVIIKLYGEDILFRKIGTLLSRRKNDE